MISLDSNGKLSSQKYTTKHSFNLNADGKFDIINSQSRVPPPFFFFFFLFFPEEYSSKCYKHATIELGSIILTSIQNKN